MRTKILVEGKETTEVDFFHTEAEVESYKRLKRAYFADTLFDEALIGFEVKEIKPKELFFRVPTKHSTLTSAWLKHFGYVYEASGIGEFTHYEVEINNSTQADKLNHFIDSLTY
ncbi:MAG: hypothetical protein IJ272_02185 [Clostridia bacterium]|nr:hypothetical protein [Clostridia bacterium]